MSQYSHLSPQDIDDLLSNYLIEHWSVSSVKTFIRNEKAFEKDYIFNDRDRLIGLSALVGICYHKALMEFFRAFKEGETMNFDALVMIAHTELESIGADKYRVSKGKTVDETKTEALVKINFVIKNFLAEVDSYLDEIQEILYVEELIYEFVVLDGIDIPVPLKMVPDLVFVNKAGELCIIDHKAKGKYTDQREINLTYSQQSTGYVIGMREKIQRPEFQPIIKKYPKTKDGVKWFYYYENKYTKNQDKTRQIKRIDIEVDETIKVYEAFLFEAVYKMLRAVQDPDYIYTINPDDNFVDKGDMFDFWVRTRIEGLDGFPNLGEKQKRILKQRKQELRMGGIKKIPKTLITAFKKQAGFVSFNNEEMSNLSIKERIEHRLRCFGLEVQVAHTIEGFSCDTYLLNTGATVKISSIQNYKMDLANAIGVADVRVSKSLVMYDGGSYLAIEVNKTNRVPLKITDKEIDRKDLRLPIGKDNYRQPHYWDLSNPSNPHLLIAGASGSGKSVAIKTIIKAAILKGIEVSIIDPKHDQHFAEFTKKAKMIREIEAIESFLAGKVEEMDNIYRSGGTDKKQLIIFDEASDCFTRQTRERKIMTEVGTYADGMPKKALKKDDKFLTLEQNTLLLAQKARSAGIHLVLASQRFSSKVLTGDAKANFPARLCLTVASGVDAKVMLDEEGAEKLNGMGDALFKLSEMGAPVRLQTYLYQ